MAETALTWRELLALSPRARRDAYDAASDHQKAVWREESVYLERGGSDARPTLLASEFEPYARMFAMDNPAGPDVGLVRAIFYAGAKAALHLLTDAAEASGKQGAAYARQVLATHENLQAEYKAFSYGQLMAEDPELLARTEARERAQLGATDHD